jgi:alanine racemase
VVRSTIADVNLDAIEHNYREIVRFIAAEPLEAGVRAPGVIAVVKANAYGHGAAPVALALERAGATMLACADIEEAIVLRRAGVKTGILVFGALGVSDVSGVFDYALTPTISTPSAGRALQEAAAKRSVVLRYHLKIDTGMNRLGLRYDNLPRTLPELLGSPNLRLVGLYTHFATADDVEHPLMEQQRVRFEEVRAYLAAEGGTASRFARLVRPRAPGTSAVRHRASAPRRDHRSAPGTLASQSARCREAHSSGRDRQLRWTVRRRAFHANRGGAGWLR